MIEAFTHPAEKPKVMAPSPEMPEVAPIETPAAPESLENRITELERRLAEVLQENVELKKQAHEDPLTGLLNRRGLARRFQEYIKTRAREKAPASYSIIMIDLKGVKQVNDTQGHEAGDRLILSAANVFRATDMCARTGGDEFIIFLPEVNEKEAEAIAKKITGRFPENLYCRMGIAASEDIEKVYGRDMGFDVVEKIADSLSNDARGKKETRENYAHQNDILTFSQVTQSLVTESAYSVPPTNIPGTESGEESSTPTEQENA